MQEQDVAVLRPQSGEQPTKRRNGSPCVDPLNHRVAGVDRDLSAETGERRELASLGAPMRPKQVDRDPEEPRARVGMRRVVLGPPAERDREGLRCKVISDAIHAQPEKPMYDREVPLEDPHEPFRVRDGLRDQL